MAAASMKRAGKVSDMEARAMQTVPSSSGCRITSRTLRGNSGSSSRNSTPLWASDTSPGRGTAPPPISPASEMVWCGERNGRTPTKSGARIEHAGDAVDLGGLQRFFKTKRRQDGGHALGQHGLAGARRADHQDVMAAGAGHFEGALGGVLAADIFEVDRHSAGLR